MSFTYRMWLLEQMKEAEKNENQQNQDNQENKQPKKYKIKEIKKIEEENDKINSSMLLEAGACALAFGVLFGISIDRDFNINEETYFNLINFFKVSLSILGVKFFGLLVKDIVKKCKNKELIESLKNKPQVNNEENLVEEIESSVKTR